MLIEYFGHSYFKISGKEFSICLDPFSSVGLKEVKTTANYLFTSHSHFDHNNVSIVKYEKLVDKSDNRFTIIKTFMDEVKVTSKINLGTTVNMVKTISKVAI
jgi:L-ascorbate metabolism protein UlaG (beta-lactamase superfamily)